MKQIIQQLSKKLYEQLPHEDFYILENLDSYGYPDFITRRLQYALHSEIRKQIKLPSRQWVNRDADEVQQTEQLFLNTLFDEARLPADSAEDFIQKSISEVLKILVQPRKNIPEMLFDDSVALTRETIEDRLKIITVYPHFSQVLSGYMKRKKRSELTKEQCSTIIANIDEKLTQNYPPQQWAQLLNPLFILTDDQANHQLFQQFFEDKQMQGVANMFKQTKEDLSREEFIEILSSNNSSEQKVPIETATRGESKKKTTFSPPPPVAGKEEEKTKSGKQTAKDSKDSYEATAGKVDNSTVNTKFAATEKQSKSINDFFASTPVEKQEDKKEINKTTSQPDEPQPRVETSPKKENSEVPIWQRFADGAKSDSPHISKTNSELEEISTKTDGSHEQNTLLKQHLASQHQLFVDELFNGSKNEYEKSISKIAKKGSWDGAAKMIRNDIFEKNKINIYSPTAIKFTDRLQNYFTGKD